MHLVSPFSGIVMWLRIVFFYLIVFYCAQRRKPSRDRMNARAFHKASRFADPG
ncbi:hypothetical protein RD1_0082 [Roseobacter denitrificans OCh 114]|uniref:Uncharacterized protein n=1 Tax=Roseobacter denitrificans (strain ATCC 33942 / OCh 114) TaxID=375451 RepID=Q16DX5_ROSDO|nr:hypothetical protein RD1_0082 [Roseobacter denitrificans OCh 114]